jgi:hypothetical protein
MFVHMFLFRWKDAATSADHARAQQEIEGFAGPIPGLRFVAAGTNISASGDGFGFGGVMHFDDEAAYKAYAVHPAHEKLLQWLVPLIDAVECDFTASANGSTPS